MNNPTLDNTSWQTPQRQSVAALLVIFLKTIWDLLKQFGIVIVLMLIQKPKHEEGYVLRQVLFWSFLGLSVLVTFLRYWFYKFSIQGENLHINSGWWQKKKLSIPLKSIQAVHIEQNIWQQMLGVARVSFDSAGSEQMEARIDALPLKKAEILKEIILACPTDTARAGKVEEARKTYRLSEEEVWKLSLSANHFKAFLLIVIFGFQFVDDIINALNADQKEALEAYTESAFSRGLNVLFILVVLGMVAFVSIAISTIRVLLEFHNFKMEETPQGWKVSQGLLTQKEKVIPSARIQLIEYSANWLRAWLDIWLIKLNITGQDKTKQQAHLAVPLVSLQSVREFTNPYLAYAPVRGAGKGINSAYWWRSTLMFALPVSLGVSLFLYLLTWHLLFVSVLFGINVLYGAVHFYILGRRFRWLATEQGLLVYKGVWGHTYTLLEWQKVQQVRLRQSIYQYKRGLADLRFMTSGGEVILPYLPLSTATMLMNQVLYRVEVVRDFKGEFSVERESKI